MSKLLIYITAKFRIKWFCNFFNKLNLGIVILNIWFTENTCKQIEMKATPFLSFFSIDVRL